MSAPLRPDDLLAQFDAWGLSHQTTKHRPVFTVEEGHDIKEQMPGGHSKNLFLKDKKGALFLLCALGETRIDLNKVSKLIGAGRFSFGSAELLYEILGVTPGSVTIFALINDRAGRVQLLLDAALMAHDPVNFHPLTNDATTAMSPGDLYRFLDRVEHPPRLLAFDEDGSPRLIDANASPI